MSPLPALTIAFCPSHEQQAIVMRLAMGDRLVGPVTVRNANGLAGQRPWGFASGVRAHGLSVKALAHRGLIAIEHAADGSRRARLIREALPS